MENGTRSATGSRSLPRKILLSVLLGAAVMSVSGIIARRVPETPVRDAVINVVATPPLLLTRTIYGLGNVNAVPGTNPDSPPGVAPLAGTVPGSWGFAFTMLGTIFYGMLWWVLISVVDWVKFGAQ